MRSVARAACLVVLTLLATGCGSTDDTAASTPPAPTYGAQVEEVLDQLAEPVVTLDLLLQARAPREPEMHEAFGVEQDIDELVNELERLTPPSTQRDAHERLVTTLEHLVAGSREFQTSAQRGASIASKARMIADDVGAGVTDIETGLTMTETMRRAIRTERAEGIAARRSAEEELHAFIELAEDYNEDVPRQRRIPDAALRINALD